MQFDRSMKHLPISIIATLLQTNQQGLACFDLSGQLLYANDYFEQLELQAPLTWQQCCPDFPGDFQQFIEQLPAPYLLQHRRTTWSIDKQEGLLCVFVDSIQPWQLLQHVGVMIIDEDTKHILWCNHTLKSQLQHNNIRTTDDLQHITWRLPTREQATDAPWISGAETQTLIAEFDDDHYNHMRVESHLSHNWRFVLFEDISEYVEQSRQQKELLSIASHELRNPLTPLKGLLQLAILQHEEENTVDFNLLQKAESQVTRLVRLANTLLDVSRLDSGQLTSQKDIVNVNVALEETINFWIARYGSNRINLSLPDQPGNLRLDLSAFEQVINNLLDNAIKFSPSHEPIFVTLKHVDNHAIIHVEDRGVGIESSHIPHLFKRFYQAEHTKKARGSLGLGLYISHKIVLEHNGTIHIDSKRGGPTTITLTFPLVD